MLRLRCLFDWSASHRGLRGREALSWVSNWIEAIQQNRFGSSNSQSTAAGLQRLSSSWFQLMGLAWTSSKKHGGRRWNWSPLYAFHATASIWVWVNFNWFDIAYWSVEVVFAQRVGSKLRGHLFFLGLGALGSWITGPNWGAPLSTSWFLERWVGSGWAEMLKYRKIFIIEHYQIVQWMTVLLLVHEEWWSLATDLCCFPRVTSAVSASWRFSRSLTFESIKPERIPQTGWNHL